MKHTLPLLAALLLASLAGLHAAAARIFVTDMRTEGVSQPMGIEEATPRFSWRYVAAWSGDEDGPAGGFAIQAGGLGRKGVS